MRGWVAIRSTPSAFDNRIYGEDGRDTLITADGNDLIDAGPGDDPDVQAGRGNNRVFGRAGRDTLRGGAGADTLECREGQGPTTGGAGADPYCSERAHPQVSGAFGSIIYALIGLRRARRCSMN